MFDNVWRRRIRIWFASLSSEQRLAVSLFVVCGLFTILFSVIHVRGLLHSPFLVSNRVLEEAKKAQGETDEQKVERLKKTDSDGDGLTDYDELYTYHTSPYLVDSDSDGVIDPVEIRRGTDPNCPEGKACQARIDENKSLEVGSLTADGSQASSTVINSGLSLQNLLPPSAVTVSQVRTFLLDNHFVEAQQLQLLSDEMVMNLYQSAYRQLTSSVATSTLPVNAPSSSTP
jgi:hypothetical protein